MHGAGVSGGKSFGHEDWAGGEIRERKKDRLGESGNRQKTGAVRGFGVGEKGLGQKESARLKALDGKKGG